MQKLKLYGFKGACSFVPHTALNLTGVDYDLQLISHADAKKPDYLAKNPQGTVPLLAIEADDFYLAQNVAILHYLDEKFPQAHIFGKGSDKQKAKAHQWLGYANADVHKAFLPLFDAGAFIDDKELQPKVAEKAQQRVIEIFKIANDNLADKDYMSGEFTIADVYLYVTLRWAHLLKLDLSGYRNLAKLIDNVESQPAVQKSLKEEGLDVIA